MKGWKPDLCYVTGLAHQQCNNGHMRLGTWPLGVCGRWLCTVNFLQKRDKWRPHQGRCGMRDYISQSRTVPLKVGWLDSLILSLSSAIPPVYCLFVSFSATLCKLLMCFSTIPILCPSEVGLGLACQLHYLCCWKHSIVWSHCVS